MKKLPVTNFLRRFYMFLAGLFLLSCLFYFLISSSLSKTNTYPHIKIFGRHISADKFRKASESQRIQLVMQLGALYEKLKPMIDIEQETLNTLILLEEAKRRKITVTSKEIVNEVAQFEIFFRNDKFDINIYRNFLKQKFDTTPEAFEENIRNTLIMRKLLEDVTSSVIIDETSAVDQYLKKQNKAQLSYIQIPFEKFKPQAETLISNADIEKRYQESKSDYFLPPAIQQEYIKLIFPKDGGVQKEVEMKFKAKAIVEEYMNGTDFKELGNKYKFPAVETDLFSKENPPDTGLNQEQISEAFKLPLKSVSAPIELPDGYLVYRVINKKSSRQGSLEEVKEKIKSELIEQKIQKLALEESQTLQKNLLESLKNNPENKNFSMLASDLKSKAEQTALETLENHFVNLKIDEDYLDQFLNISLEKPLSSPILAQNAFLILHVDTFEDAKIALDPKQKDAILQEALIIEKEKVWKEFAEETLKEAHLEIMYP